MQLMEHLLQILKNENDEEKVQAFDGPEIEQKDSEALNN